MKHKSLVMSLVGLCLAFLPLSIFANQETVPPLDLESLVGTWEALEYPQELHLLLHMQINPIGASYLVEATASGVGSIRRLLSAEVKNGFARLHFGKPFYGQSAKPDCWIVGRADPAIIKGQLILCEDCSPPEFPWSSTNLPMVTEITLAKGPWARDLGEASRIAEEKIRDVTGADATTGIEGVITVEIVQGGSSSPGPAANSTFTVENGNETVAAFTTDKEGRFRVWLKPNHYIVSTIGDTGGPNSCGPFEADVRVGQMTKVEWCCEVDVK